MIDERPLPITVLTGFLGSGKTTLLNALLRSSWFRDAAVLVNELGAIGIDHLLVRHADEELVLLESGCVCCTLRGDLVRQLEDLFDKRARGEVPPFTRVVLETTGLADPAPVVQTLMSHPRLSMALYLDGVVTTVDAQHAESTLERYGESRKQLAIADRVIVTKTDLVDPDALARVERIVRALAPASTVSRAALGAIDARELVGMGHLDTRSLAGGRETAGLGLGLGLGLGHDENGEHTHVKSVAVTLEQPVDFRSFSLWVAMLTQLNGERILRLKAIVSPRGEPTPVAVQAVQHVVYPPLTLPPMPELDGKSHIVVLTHGFSNQELVELEQSLRALRTD